MKNNNSIRGLRRLRATARGILMVAGLAAASQLSTAAVTDLANVPIATARNYVEPPNIMLLMDTSESMSWGHVPDALENATSDVMPVGYKGYQCNALYFNPTKSYSLPKNNSGGTLPEPDFAAAYVDYYRDNFGNNTLTRDLDFYGNPAKLVNLETEFQAYTQITRKNKDPNAADTKQQAYYYVYTGPQLGSDGKLDPTGLACKTPDSGAATITALGTGGGTWTRTKVPTDTSEASTALRKNFTRWYTYYRTRMAVTKSGIGLAFSSLPTSYRLGFLTMDPYAITTTSVPSTTNMADPTKSSRPARTTIDNGQFTSLAPFGEAQRQTWYSRLYAQQAVGASPAREALARVGRHYANETDEINTGMPAGAITAACQQNFTIMTTDGTWNTGAESDNGGPLKLNRDFTSGRWVGQQDGDLSNPLSPRPIYDGGRGGSRETINQNTTYTEANCVGGWYRRSVKQTVQTVIQVSKEEKQQFQRQEKVWQSTFQRKETSSAVQETVRQVRQTQRQMFRKDSQALRSTVQDIRWTEQPQSRGTQQQKRTLQTLADTKQIFRTDTQTKARITYWNKKTFQKLRTQYRQYQTVTQNLRTDRRWYVSTAQITQTKTQVKRSTSQLVKRTFQVSESTSQLRRYDGATEQDFGVETCTTGGTVYCYTVTTGPTPVAACTPDAKSAGNGWKERTCSTTSDTGWVGAASCSAVPPTSGNSFMKTECDTLTTAPTLVASCVSAAAGSGNSYVRTTCDVTTYEATAGVNACSAGNTGAPNYITTTCGNNNTGPLAAAACTPQGKTIGNQYTQTTCEDRLIVATYGVQSCSDGFESDNVTRRICTSGNVARTNVDTCTAQTGGTGNAWKTIVCDNVASGTANEPVQTCTAGSTGGLTTTCADNNSNVAQTATCTAASATSPSWTQTTCTEVVVSNNGVASCTPRTGNGADGTSPDNYTTTCVNANVAERAVQSCNDQTGSGSNQYLTIACRTDVQTNVPVASCAVNSGTTPTWLATTKCTANNSAWANGACSPIVATQANGWTTTQCQTVTSGTWTNVPNCTPVTAGPSTGGTGNTCQLVTTPEVAVETCTASAGVAPNWVTVKCRQNTTTNVPVASCTPIAESSPNWIATTCSNANVDWRAVASCTPQVATSPNWITIECDNRTLQSAEYVSSCTPGTSGSFVVTTCDTSANRTDVWVASCTDQTGNAGNDWKTVTCTRPVGVNYTAKNVASCTPQTAAFSNNYTTITCADNNTAEQLVATCTPVGATSPDFIRTNCRIETVTAEAAVAYNTCTPVPATAGNGYVATFCRTDNAPNAPAQSCTAQAPTAANGYREVICTDLGSAPAPVADNSCVTTSPSAGNGWKQIICNSTTTADVGMTQSCSPTSGGGSGPNYNITICSPAPAQKITYSGTRTSISTILSGNAAVGTPTTVTTNYGPLDYDGICYTPGAPSPAPVKPALPLDVAVQSPVSLAPLPPSSCDGGSPTWPCIITTAPAANSDDKGSKNSLADVAQYYYVTDLRPDLANKVASLGSGDEADTAAWQHMTTFSIGLGVSGQLKYTKDYRSAASGDFQDIRAGRKLDGTEANWPVWPAPVNTFSPAATLNSKGNYTNPLLYEDPRSIDDFWHAAVNGRGRYLSADDPDSVITGVSDALLAIQNSSGAGAGAATSALSPVAGDNMAYTATFTSREWTGDLQAYEIDVVTNELAETPRWSAKTQLNTQVGAYCDNRKIVYFKSSNASKLANFTWETLACGTGMTPGPDAASSELETDLRTLFSDTAKLGTLAQWPSMLNSAAGFDQRAWLAGPRLVNFLRGQRGYEEYVADADGIVDSSKPAEMTQARKVFRKREGVLGDIVNSQPAYVKEPTQNYQDAGYQAFRNANKTRAPMIYVGANDGMLHAFNAPRTADASTQGKEAWAYVPRAVMGNMFRLADTEYEFESKHRFFVDGSPVVGDFKDASDGSQWKTLLVGGLNKGGKGYYAIDVTDPATPKGMWEFDLTTACFDASAAGTQSGDCGLGYTFGKPVITKLADGTWVVLVTSGYNNINTGNGEPDVGAGFLYVINASTGKLMQRIATGAGSAGSPANMRDVNTYVANVSLDNTALRVYGGDMLGNVWRFNINKVDGDGNPAPSATLLGKTLSSGGAVQPITTNVELAEINGDTMVFVGTGRLVSESDLDDKSAQSVFAFKDPLTEPELPDPAIGGSSGNLRAALKPLRIVQKTLKFKPGTRDLADEGATAYDEVDTRTVECTGNASTTCLVNGGWVLDLPDTGERVNVDMRIALNTLAFASNVPQTEICSSGGYSWLNYLDLYTGNAVSTSPAGMISTRLDAITVGLGLLVSGDGRTSGLITGSDGKKPQPYEIPTGTPGPVGRRISWREVMQ